MSDIQLMWSDVVMSDVQLMWSEVVMSDFSSVIWGWVSATAACEGMKPYFQEIIEHFRGYLISATEEDTKKLQVAAIGKR